MSSMEIWTTFFPKKVAWEITSAMANGEGGSSDWLKHEAIINEALQTLKKAGIKGVRLIIIPTELTTDGKQYDWSPVEKALSLCHKHKLAVDFCLGPFQYAHYPGIRLPQMLQRDVNEGLAFLDTNPKLREYGLRFLELQLKRYSRDARIRGFYLGNEWPDRNIVERTTIKIGVSRGFMAESASIAKDATVKPILFNTNIDPASQRRLFEVFQPFHEILGKQMRLGFDPYPSRERWDVTPLVKMKRFVKSYSACVENVCSVFDKSQLFFAEVEAQPWGHGESWYRLIKESKNPNEKIYNFHKDDLKKTFAKYISPTGIQEVSLWSPEFWLVAQFMGIAWPLEEVKKLSS